MSDRKHDLKALFEIELNIEISELAVFFDEDGIVLAQAGKDLYLYDGTLVYKIGSHGYEPCTYLMREGGVSTAIHNAFNESEILSLAKRGGVIRTVTGTEYDMERLCRFLAFASAFSDCGIDYVEGKMAIEKLKELGATSPEKAVPIQMTGINYIPSALSRSKKLKERIMETEDGKVFVRIKPQ